MVAGISVESVQDIGPRAGRGVSVEFSGFGIFICSCLGFGFGGELGCFDGKEAAAHFLI